MRQDWSGFILWVFRCPQLLPTGPSQPFGLILIDPSGNKYFARVGIDSDWQSAAIKVAKGQVSDLPFSPS